MNDEQAPIDDNKLVAERRAKLDALRESGPAFPNDFRRTARAGELQERYQDAEKDALWPKLDAVIPQFRVYRKRTDRNIRIFRLKPRGGAA